MIIIKIWMVLVFVDFITSGMLQKYWIRVYQKDMPWYVKLSCVLTFINMIGFVYAVCYFILWMFGVIS